jgi:hypothetical protein
MNVGTGRETPQGRPSALVRGLDGHIRGTAGSTTHPEVPLTEGHIYFSLCSGLDA